MSTNILVALALFVVAQVCVVLADYLQWNAMDYDC
jgi:hypothetical protein